MSPVEVEIVRKKLSVMIENLKALEPIKNMKKDEFIKDIYKRKATERLSQELIEAGIDINTHIIVQTGNTVPDDYYESFIRAGELKIISMDLAEKLAPSAGLRNRLVHEYDSLDHDMVLDAVRMAELHYPKYINEIENYILGVGGAPKAPNPAAVAPCKTDFGRTSPLTTLLKKDETRLKSEKAVFFS